MRRIETFIVIEICLWRMELGEVVVGSNDDEGELDGIYTDLGTLNSWVYSFTYSCRVLEST